MKVLVTGANGQLGYDVVKELQKRNIECYGAMRQDFDIVDFEAVEKFIVSYMPDAIIHCAAYTAVDKAEDEQGLCYLVNASATENIAEICKKINAKMLYISTDYVFDGTKDGFYEVYDKPNPINVYGKTKLLGEQAVQRILDKYFIVKSDLTIIFDLYIKFKFLSISFINKLILFFLLEHIISYFLQQNSLFSMLLPGAVPASHR